MLFTYEFDKNANSYCKWHRLVLALSVGLATIGVCVFCALTLIGALFLWGSAFRRLGQKISLIFTGGKKYG